MELKKTKQKNAHCPLHAYMLLFETWHVDPNSEHTKNEPA